MLNFIVCDDNEMIRVRIIKIISKLMMPMDIEYKTHEFGSYNKEFNQLTNKEIGKKIYILDVEMGDRSGLDVARMIREKDWQSLIIILTAHYELAHDAFKERLMLLDYISKFDDYERKLLEALKLGMKIIYSTSTLNFMFNRVIYKIPFSDILYIAKDESNRKIIIKTFYDEYTSTMTLNEIIRKLDSSFCRTHRACIVNYSNVKAFDYKNNIIIFKNNETINLLSRNYKKEVKKLCM